MMGIEQYSQAKKNGVKCEACGGECIDRCPVCGAPQCCPRCCDEEMNKVVFVDKDTKVEITNWDLWVAP